MKNAVNIRLNFFYYGKQYDIQVKSLSYAETLIVNKLLIGNVRLWLILQNNNWQFISDMPLCRDLKDNLIRKIAASLNISCTNELMVADQGPMRAGVVLGAILNLIAIKKGLPQ